MTYIGKGNLTTTQPIVDLVVNMDIHSFMCIFWHETIALFTIQTIVNSELGDWIADIVIKPCNHSHLTFNAMGKVFHIDITKRLFKASNILGIHVLDHIIVTPADYFSFMENGLVFQRQIE